ncbi:branched-chain amino acid ABC transporter permease [Microtetraspora sp. NBRC 16547]|uniref:branched-chain amino acid ABC transporter permease n=1 Tax=Microtetraspora sp. NBRC 16547 TaxID=3030993 RepID=UPI0024A33001|nr:branched-chain amino acid ABC transporter permease [Microtetraspora sp. NBRC 16547]GLW99335.1 branched-chain amino acid ABC transporter permease [Microtetraspora sp. NBRC 16547]
MTATRRNAAGLVVLALAVLVPPALGEYRTYVLCLMAIYAIGSIGLTVLVGHGGMISLGHAGLVCVGAYGASLLMIRADVSFWLALPLATAIGMLVGLALGYPFLKLDGPYLAIATFGFAVALPEVINRWSAFGVGDPALFGGALGLNPPSPAIGSLIINTSLRFWYVCLAVLVVAVLLARRILSSRWGQDLRAYRQSPPAASAYGVRTRRVRVWSFAVAGGYAGLCGALLAHHLGAVGTSSFSLTLSITFLMMVVIGGVESVAGAVVGAVAVVALQEWLTGQTSNLQLWYGVALLLAVMFLRGGVVGMVQARLRRLRHRDEAEHA